LSDDSVNHSNCGWKPSAVYDNNIFQTQHLKQNVCDWKRSKNTSLFPGGISNSRQADMILLELGKFRLGSNFLPSPSGKDSFQSAVCKHGKLFFFERVELI
jgi:hypothetical protein